MLFAKTTASCARLVLRPLYSRSFSGIWFREGDTASITKTFTSQDVQKFAELSEDTNPIHVNDEYAETARFGKCIVHGILVNGLISAVLGTKLPGPGTIVLSQMCEFPAPLYIGEPVTASVTVVNIDRRLVTCSASCIANERNEIVLTGSVRLLVPRKKPSISPQKQQRGTKLDAKEKYKPTPLFSRPMKGPLDYTWFIS